MVGSSATPSALSQCNFRRYFVTQVVSNVGTWVQITAENWLVLTLSHSGLALGVTNALQFGPSLFLGMYGGVVADRHDRRRLLMATQACLGLLALTIGLLAAFGLVRLWMIWLAATGLGLVKCFDLPALQGFVKDLVGSAALPNAVAWMNATNATGRMLGAACGGVLLTELGAASGFVVNAASFALIVLMLATLSRGELAPQMPVAREPGQIRQGLRYVCSDHVLVATAIMMLVVFPAAYNFQIAIALIVSTTLAGDGQTYGALMAVLGLGALAGSVLLTRWVRTGLPAIIAWTGTLAVAQAMASAVHSLELLLAACFAYGVSASLFSVTVVGTLQARTRDEMRGRVMALYAICFNGSVLWGGPAFGGIAQWLGVSAALRGSAAICALLALAAAGYRLSAKFIQSGERRYSADYQP